MVLLQRNNWTLGRFGQIFNPGIILDSRKLYYILSINSNQQNSVLLMKLTIIQINIRVDAENFDQQKGLCCPNLIEICRIYSSLLQQCFHNTFQHYKLLQTTCMQAKSLLQQYLTKCKSFTVHTHSFSHTNAE